MILLFSASISWDCLNSSFYLYSLFDIVVSDGLVSHSSSLHFVPYRSFLKQVVV